ncbi:MAG: amidohydrolase family protein [Nevskia sp.]|nr:amidohydrolase family protein [Nevskia sp.]
MAKLDDLILVSVDDHLIEPPDLFANHIDAQYKSRAPRVERKNGRDFWTFEGKVYPSIGLNAVAGRPLDEYGMEPTSYEGMRRGCFDIQARVDDMNANGLLGSLCFPTFPGFAGTGFLQIADKELLYATIRAYNDWHVHVWCGTFAGRMIPLILLPLWDVELCVKEIKRLVPHGVHAISFPDSPSSLNLPSIHQAYWDPLWKVCADNKVVICTHIGSGSSPPHASLDTPIDAWITTFPMTIALSAGDWLHAPMWKKYPDLRLALSEGGIGWVPYFLERADITHRHHKGWTHANFGTEMPSDVFRRHFITCFIEDAFGLRNIADCGEDRVTYECDYPHSDSNWPQSPEGLLSSLEGVADTVIDKVTHLNAMREFSFDPFSLLGRHNCTVGALRSKASHVDCRPVSGLGGAASPLQGEKRPVTSGDVQRMFASTTA